MGWTKTVLSPAGHSISIRCNVQNGSGFQPASYTTGTGLLSSGTQQTGREVTHSPLKPRLRKRGDISPLPTTSVLRRVTQLSARITWLFKTSGDDNVGRNTERRVRKHRVKMRTAVSWFSITSAADLSISGAEPFAAFAVNIHAAYRRP
jgi:hypothetical protein